MKQFILGGALLALTTFAACGDSDPVSAAPNVALSTSVIAALDTSIQDEYHAEQTYLHVLADFGNVIPFFNVVIAEQRHSSSLAAMYQRYGIDVPVSLWHLGNVPTFTTLQAACTGAAAAEVANIEIYDRFLRLDLPADVRAVLASNREASLVRHYPAFMQCR